MRILPARHRLEAGADVERIGAEPRGGPRIGRIEAAGEQAALQLRPAGDARPVEGPAGAAAAPESNSSRSAPARGPMGPAPTAPRPRFRSPREAGRERARPPPRRRATGRHGGRAARAAATDCGRIGVAEDPDDPAFRSGRRGSPRPGASVTARGVPGTMTRPAWVAPAARRHVEIGGVGEAADLDPAEGERARRFGRPRGAHQRACRPGRRRHNGASRATSPRSLIPDSATTAGRPGPAAPAARSSRDRPPASADRDC